MTRPDQKNVPIRDVLEKYRLTKPVPPEFQKHMSKRTGPLFTRILKKTGTYSFFYGIFLSFYFFLKRFGITFTVSKTILSIVTAVTISVCGYFAYTYFTLFEENSKIHIDPGNVEITVKDTNRDTQEKTVAIQYTLGIMPFTSSTVDKKIVRSFAHRISRTLRDFRGAHFSKITSGSRTASVKYVLRGNIEKLDNTYILFVKVIDVKDSSINYAGKEKASSEAELEESYKRISQKISSRIK